MSYGVGNGLAKGVEGVAEEVAAGETKMDPGLFFKIVEPNHATAATPTVCPIAIVPTDSER